MKFNKIFLFFTCAILIGCSDNKKIEISYADQSKFIKVIQKYLTIYTNSYQVNNDVANSKVRLGRKNALKEFPPNIKDWKVSFLSATSSFGNRTDLKFSDYNMSITTYSTEVKNNSNIYNFISGLKFGQTVYITGTLELNKSGLDYFSETSWTESGSMLAPNFEVNISSISKNRTLNDNEIKQGSKDNQGTPKLTTNELRIALSNMGLCSGCAHNVIQHYFKRPDSQCTKLALDALSGDSISIDKLVYFPDYCGWDD